MIVYFSIKFESRYLSAFHINSTPQSPEVSITPHSLSIEMQSWPYGILNNKLFFSGSSLDTPSSFPSSLRIRLFFKNFWYLCTRPFRDYCRDKLMRSIAGCTGASCALVTVSAFYHHGRISYSDLPRNSIPNFDLLRRPDWIEQSIQ